MLLENKVVVVSGIGPGLGVKLAVEAAREGARGIVALARTAEKLEDAERRVRELGTACKVLKIPADITDAAQCRRAAEQAVAAFGRIDGLINSAFHYGNVEPVEHAEVEAWKQVYGTNVIGSMQMTLAVVPQMKIQGGGAVVMINTQATVKPSRGHSAYAVSKGGLLVAAKYLATELGPYNIRVNTARMGWMWGVPVQGAIPLMAQAQGKTEQQVLEESASTKALRRIVTDDECARAALFLISDYASAVTGAILDANGGETMP